VWCIVFVAFFNGAMASVDLEFMDHNNTQVYDIDIPEQGLASALTQLSEQTNIQVLFTYHLVKNRRANAVFGTLTLQQAMNGLLQGSGLSGGLSNKGVLTISLKELKASYNQGEDMMNRKKNILASTIAFFVGIGGVHNVVAEEIGGAASDER